ncbi:MAG: M42 family metallopeptidase [Candidatus Brocadiia bacterium]
MKDSTLELLKTLSEMDGVSGFETEVRNRVKSELKGAVEFENDNLGSLVCRKRGTEDKPSIMIPAHMDEVGFVVKDIDETGCLRFATLGGWLEQVMLSHDVVVHTRNGKIPGVIGCTPPHMMPKEDREKLIKKKQMFIDVGARDKKDAEERGVRIGDPVIPRQQFCQMANENYLLGKAWDDRVGCALMIELLKDLQEIEHPNTVCGVGTVQEEVGTRGAETSADVVDPDFCVVLDVGIATDVPGIENEAKVELGKGPILYMLDAGTISHKRFRDFVLEIAEEKEIPHQLSLIEGGATDARAVQLHSRGVASVVLGIPTRYIHSHAGIIHVDDFDATLELLTEIAKNLDPDTADELLSRD